MEGVVYWPPGNDETDGLLRRGGEGEGRRRVRVCVVASLSLRRPAGGSSGGGRRRRRGVGTVDEVAPLSVYTGHKTHHSCLGRPPTLLPANTHQPYRA